MAYSELAPLCGQLKTDLLWLTDVKYFERVDSTQKRIEQFLPKSGEGIFCILAESQTKGVGRLGRVWVSPPGGVWMTVAFPLKNLTVEQASSFSLVSALCTVESLREVNDLTCRIKWPNDILYKGKKLGGILLSTTTKFKKPWLLIGVGINVNNDLPLEMVGATSIKDVRNQTQGRARLVESILASLWTAWEEFGRTGFGPYQKNFVAKLHGVGESTKVVVGSRPFEGVLRGVDPLGGLLLQSGSATKTVTAGEIVD